MNFETTLEELERALEDLGYAISDKIAEFEMWLWGITAMIVLGVIFLAAAVILLAKIHREVSEQTKLMIEARDHRRAVAP